MNRRSFFSFLPSAAVGVAAVASIKPEPVAAAPTVPPPNYIRSDPSGYRCNCGSHLHPFVTGHHGGRSLPRNNHNHTHSFSIAAVRVCSWCGNPRRAL